MDIVNYETIGSKSGELKTASNHQLYINDINIDNKYSNIKDTHVETIDIAGREMISQDLETVVPKGMHGSQIITTQFKPRKLEIVLQVEAEESKMKDFYKQFMMDLWNLTNVKFSDENLYYFGRYIDFKKEEIKSTLHIITITILCNDVFKYTQEKQRIYTDSVTFKVLLDTLIPVQPIVTIVLSSNTSTFYLYAQDAKDSNNKKYIYIQNSTILPRTIRINFKDFSVVGDPFHQPVDLMHTIRIDSDVENFKINDGDYIHVSTPFNSFSMSYRGVYL